MLRVVPNPTNNIFRLFVDRSNSADLLGVKLYSSTGQLLKSYIEGNQTLRDRIYSVPKGVTGVIYLAATFKSGTEVEKIILR